VEGGRTFWGRATGTPEEHLEIGKTTKKGKGKRGWERLRGGGWL